MSLLFLFLSVVLFSCWVVTLLPKKVLLFPPFLSPFFSFSFLFFFFSFFLFFFFSFFLFFFFSFFLFFFFFCFFFVFFFSFFFFFFLFLFLTEKKKSGRQTDSIYGIMLMGGYLFFDGFTSTFQEKLFKVFTFYFTLSFLFFSFLFFSFLFFSFLFFSFLFSLSLLFFSNRTTPFPAITKCST